MSENLITFAPGETVIHAKKPCDGIYIVREGKLKVTKLDKENKEVPVGLIGPGEFVGETSFFLEQPHSSSVVALTEAKLAKLPIKVLQEQSKSAPAWMLALVKGLIVRLHKANDILKRNNWVDSDLANQINTLEQKSKTNPEIKPAKIHEPEKKAQ